MNSNVIIDMILCEAKGYDRRDPSKTFDETVVMATNVGKKPYEEIMKEYYNEKGYQIDEIILPDRGIKRSASLDLRQLYEKAGKNEDSEELLADSLC